MFTQAHARPVNRGGVIGLSLGRFAFIGAGVAAVFAGTTLAGPEGAKVVRGNAKIHQNGNFTRIRASDGAIINYNSFNVGVNESVRFVQPSRDARVLNRISGEAPTFINGSIRANGNVYFVNPAGITFGNGAVVDVGGLYAAAGNISNRDFINNVNRFSGLSGSVVNEGSINADGGVAALIGREVANRGVIAADSGLVAMVSGEDVILQQRGSNFSVKVEGLARSDSAQVQGVGVENTGSVSAKRGRALMVAGDMYSLAINNTGSVQARNTTIEGQGNATVKVGGTIDARNAVSGNRGGTVDVTGHKVIISDARIDASGAHGGGTVNIGGRLQGNGDLRTADTTLVSTGSEITADAIRRGDGGQVVVWADNHTGFYGKASADGGTQSGDGGFVETSGKETLDIRGGRVSAAAKSESGSGGTWLLDPRNVTIDAVATSGGTFDAGDPDTFTPNADDAIVDVADIVMALEGGTSVQILTGNTGVQDGNITVASAINKAAGGDATLTLRAANDINVNANITSSAGELNVELLANDGTGGNGDLDANSGSVSIASGVTIDTFGGDLTVRGEGFLADAMSTITGGLGAVDVDVNGNATLGAVAADSLTVIAGGTYQGLGATGLNITNNASITTEAGDLTLGITTVGGIFEAASTGGDISQTGTLSITGTSAFVARNGTGGQITLTDAMNTFGSGVEIRSRLADDSDFGDGAIQLVTSGTLDVTGARTTGDLSLTADDIVVNGPVRGDSSITISNLNPGEAIFLGGSGMGLSLSAAELAQFDTDGTLSIGGTDTGSIFVGDDGAIDLSGLGLTRLALRAGDMTFAAGITLPDSATAALTADTGGIDGSTPGDDIIVGGVNGSLVIDAAGNVDLDTAVGRVAADLSAGSLTLRNTGNLRIGMVDAVSGVTVAAGEDIDITADGGLTVNFDVTTSGAGSIALTAEGGDDGHLIVNAAVSAADGDITLDADDDITLNAGAAIASATGNVTLTADFDDMTSGGPLDGGSIVTVAGATVNAGADAVFGAGGSIALVTGASAIAGDSLQFTAGGDIDLDGTATAASFQLEAGDDIDLRTDLAATGAAGVSIIAGGTLTVDTTNAITSAGNPISLTIGGLGLLGTIDAGMGNVAIEIADTGTVGVGEAVGDLTVSNADMAKITASQLSIGGANATLITADGVTDAATTNIDTVLLDATGNGARVVFSGTDSTFNALTVNADDGIDVDVSIRADVGDITLDGDADNAADTDDAINIALGALIATTPTGGSITLSAANGGIIGEGAITLDANQDLIVNDNISAPGIIALFSGGLMTLGGEVTGNSIRIESDNGVTIGQNITSQTGDVRVNADVDDDGMGTAVIDAGATVTSNNNGIEIIAADLQLDGSLDGGTGDITIARSADGSFGLGSAAGGMQISGDELSRISAETLFLGNRRETTTAVDGVTAAHTANILTGINLRTNDLDITGGFELANGTLTIDRVTDGTLGLGTATGDMTIDNDELGRIVANSLILGGDTIANITVSGVTGTASDGIASALTLTSQDTITFSSGASTFNQLIAQADQLIRVNANITTDTGAMALNGDLDGGGTGTNGITFSANRTLTSAGQILLQAGSGGMVGAGALTLNAGQNVQIAANLTTNGTTIINADTDGNGGVATIALGSTVNTNSSALRITASDLALEGSLNSGAGETRILRSSLGTVGLGAATGQDMIITGAELQRIIATGLVIGGDNTSRIVANGVTAANTASIAAGVTLNALADNAQVEFTGTNSVFGTLDVNADNGILVNAQLTTNIGDLTFNPDADDAADGNDSIVLNDDVGAGSHDVNFEGNTRVGQNVIVSGNDVRFRGTVRSRTATARSLTVNTNNAGVTLFERAVGGGDRPLAALTTNADGVTRIGANITTSGGTMTFNDAVRLTAENITLTDTGGTGIFFNNTLDAAMGVTPSLSFRWLNNNLPADNTLPIVSFANNVGALNPLENIYFNFNPGEGIDGRVNPPRIASIIARPRNSAGAIVTNPTTPYSVQFNTTGEFRMGQNEKLTVGGAVTINAATAVLGDITALGNITVNAGSIELNSRIPGTLLAPDGSIGQDMGLDFVSGGEMNFSVTPTVNGTGRVAFSTPDGTGDANGNLSTFIFQSFGDLPASLITRTVNNNVITLDLRAEGPTNTNISDAIAGAIPRETRFSDVGGDPVVGQAQIEELRQLGIIPRTLDLPELLALLVGWGLYNDYPTATDGASTYSTAVNRLPGPEVTALLRDYDRVFNRDLVDEDGLPVIDENGKVRRVSRASEIQDALYQSVRRYLTANPGTTSIDAARFREYIDTSPDETVSRAYIEQLADFLNRLEYLGLTTRELALSKNVLLAPVRPRGIATIQQFEAVIRGSEMATTGN